MGGQIPVSLEVGSRGTADPASALPRTGLDIAILLGLAALLLAFGYLLTRIRLQGGTKMSRRFVSVTALTAALLLAAAVAAPASEVTVSLSNPPGSRTVYVEDLLGNPLDSLDFQTGRSLPFRVRVVDADMFRNDFDVQSSMSNLYLADGESYAWEEKIDSARVRLSYSASALNVVDVKAFVSPIFDITGTTLCGLLGKLPGDPSCAINDLEGKWQNLVLPVDLSDLSGLPLLPQTGESGPFTDPNYSGIGDGDPNEPGSWSATQLRVMSGGAVDTAAVIANVQSRLSTDLSGLGADEVVDPAVLTTAIQQMLGPVYDTLNAAQLQALIDDLNWTLNDLTGLDVERQSGTYFAYPIINVDVPGDAATGTYRGTLVLTFTQL